MGKNKPKKKPPRGIPTGSASVSSDSPSSKSPPESPISAGEASASSSVKRLPESSATPANHPASDSCTATPPVISDVAIANPSSATVKETVLVTATATTSSADVPVIAATVVVDEPLNKPVEVLAAPISPPAESGKPPKKQDHPWKDLVKGSSVKMEKQGTPFLLDSGEACVTIPNSVIEKNKKAWESFILGQFYEDPPSRGAVHAIVNGIWSRQRRDIKVSKLEGHSFLFKVPCPNARRRILSQSLWQVDGQTMFVAKWSPDIIPKKPELTMVPVWLDFVGVPLEFFNKDSLNRIAGIVGHPICLHPQTERLDNVEVAKVYTVIDPRKPLPEAVNARFESGQIKRILVSSPWLPSLCSHCKQVGHTFSRCSKAPLSCNICGSGKHNGAACPRAKKEKAKGKAPIQSQLPIVEISTVAAPPKHVVAKPAAKDPKQSIWQPVKKTQQNVGSSSPAKASTPPAGMKPAYQDFSKAFAMSRDEGKLCVDLSANSFASLSQQSDSGGTETSDSDQDSFSEEDDNPEADSDRFLKVISKRALKRQGSKARARGPSNL